MAAPRPPILDPNVALLGGGAAFPEPRVPISLYADSLGTEPSMARTGSVGNGAVLKVDTEALTVFMCSSGVMG